MGIAADIATRELMKSMEADWHWDFLPAAVKQKIEEDIHSAFQDIEQCRNPKQMNLGL